MQNVLNYLQKSLPLLIVLLAIPLAFYVLDSGKIKRPKKLHHNQNKQRVVKVSPLVKSAVTPTWQTTGTVTASESVNVVAEISGKIQTVNPQAQPGAFLAKGEWLVQVDKTDYAIALRTEQADLVQAQASLALEEANQVLAKEELSSIDNIAQHDIETALILREPQLLMAQAKVDIAKASFEKAQVALQRTQIKMPFEGKIVSRSVGRGSRVGQNSALFQVVNVAAFWLEVKVPRSFLSLLDTSEPAILSQDKLWGEGVNRTARFVSVLPELDRRDRQVKLLYAIDDPLLYRQTNNDQEQQPAIFVNDFLNVKLKGKAITDAWVIDNNRVEPDDTVWVVDSKNTLQKRHTTIKFKSRELIYLQGEFQSNDRVLNEKPGIASIGLKVRPQHIENTENLAITKVKIDAKKSDEFAAEKPQQQGAN